MTDEEYRNIGLILDDLHQAHKDRDEARGLARWLFCNAIMSEERGKKLLFAFRWLLPAEVGEPSWLRELQPLDGEGP